MQSWRSGWLYSAKARAGLTTMNPEIAHIGLGSNLASFAGGPRETLAAAIVKLADFAEVVAQSSLYETEPVGYAQQPRFLNAAVAIQTDLQPLNLLQRLLAIEREFGRDRSMTPLKGPRSLDLDLLLMGSEILDLQQLTLPHPSLATRRFVLAPLAEIAPEAMHPLLGKTVVALLRDLPDEGENRIAAVNISR